MELRISPIRRFRILGLYCFFVGTLLVLWCAANLFVGANPFDFNPFDDRPFELRTWAEDATCPDGGNRRGRMCDDLLKRHLHFGESKKEVVDLLGEAAVVPNGPATLRNIVAWSKPHLLVAQPKWDERAAAVLKYHVGEEFNLLIGIDQAAIYLAFDSEDRYVGGAVGRP